MLIIEKIKNTPIELESKQNVSNREIEWLKNNSDSVELAAAPRLFLLNEYYGKLDGAASRMFCRKSVFEKINQALEILPKDYGFCIYDAFRSRRTQQALWNEIEKQVRESNPKFTPQELFLETRKYVSHPDDHARFPVSPHNSGGAIDITITYKGNILDMGSGFDDPREISSTRFFESVFDPKWNLSKDQWNLAKENRRILYFSLTGVGFTNYDNEYWHFDLGNCLFANQTGIDWYYDSMESEIKY